MSRMQLQIDLDDAAGQQKRASQRGRQRAEIERLEIPAPPSGWQSRPPAPSTCKTVLLALDDCIRNGEGWRVKRATLCARCGFRAPGTISRAIAWLVELGLVSVVRTGRSTLYQLERQALSRHAAEGFAQTSDVCGANIRSSRRKHQMFAAQTSTPPERLNTHSTTLRCAALAAAAEDLQQAGVYRPTVAALLPQLSARGIAADQVQAAVRFWRSAGGGTPAARWDAGALVSWLRHCQPGDDPADPAGWPKAAEPAPMTSGGHSPPDPVETIRWQVYRRGRELGKTQPEIEAEIRRVLKRQEVVTNG